MFKYNVKYKDFNGNDRDEDLYFHLSLPEVTRLEAEIGKTLTDYAKDLTANMDIQKLLQFIEKILLQSYGKKSPDGRSFIKTQSIRDEFEYSQAYAEVFEEMINNPELARKFGEAVADDGKQRKNQVTPSVVNGQ